jgi:hypothetical protein
MGQSSRLNPFESPQAPTLSEALSQLCFSGVGASFFTTTKGTEGTEMEGDL